MSVTTEVVPVDRHELEELRKDAARYRFLRDMNPHQLYLSRNEGQSNNHTDAAGWINLDPQWFEDETPEQIQRMKDANTIWTLQVYPITSIGFYAVNAATLDEVIDRAVAD